MGPNPSGTGEPTRQYGVRSTDGVQSADNACQPENVPQLKILANKMELASVRQCTQDHTFLCLCVDVWPSSITP
jgi:hypothetical protein